MAVRIVRQHRRISVTLLTVSALFSLQAVAIYRVDREFNAISEPGLATYNLCILLIAGDTAIGRSFVRRLFLADARGYWCAVGVPLGRSAASTSPFYLPNYLYVVSHIVNSAGVPSGHAFTSSRVPRIDRTGFRPSTTMNSVGGRFLFLRSSHHRQALFGPHSWQVVLLRASPSWDELAAFFIPSQSLVIDG